MPLTQPSSPPPSLPSLFTTPPFPPSPCTGLGDVLLLTLLRGCVVMLPLLGLSATVPWLCAAVTAVVGMSSYLAAKAALLYQLAPAGRTLVVQDTGVSLHVPTLVAAEVLGLFMGWFLLVLVWVNRAVIRQPAAADPIMALHSRTAAAVAQQRLAVREWVTTHQPIGELEADLSVPLLAQAAAAEAGAAGLPSSTRGLGGNSGGHGRDMGAVQHPVGSCAANDGGGAAGAAVGARGGVDDDGVSFVSAYSQLSQRLSWASAASAHSLQQAGSPPGDAAQ